MFKNRFFNVLIGLVLVSLMLAACGSLSSSQSNFPTGKFVWAGSDSVGIYLNEDKTYSAFYYSAEVDKGTYEVEANLFTQTSDYPNLATECAAPATYEWSFDGTNLKFKLHGEDMCDVRRESFDGQTFILTE
jgi:hypothetical protein